LYLNDGKGILQSKKVTYPTNSNVSVIAPYDFDNDGDIDVFIGSVPGVYGLIQSICCWKMMEKLYKQY
jgi:hypothetical protein